MNETAEVLHHVPGRLRLRLSSLKGDAARLEDIRRSLEELPGVTRVKASSVLGSILIGYDSALFTHFVGALENYAKERSLFSIMCGDTEPCVSETHRSLSHALGDLNRSVQRAMGNTINLKELLPLAAALYGFLFVDRAAASAQWLNWLQFAFDTYIDLHEEQPVIELAQKVDSLGTQILDRQVTTTESLHAEMAALRAQIERLAERLPAPQGS